MAVARHPSRLLVAALGIYFIVNIAVRLALPATLELDEAEQVFHSQWLLLGYGPQPPLYNWLQIAVFSLTGRSIFGLSLLKNLLLFSCYLFYWLAARKALKDDGLRIAAVLGLLTLPQVSYMAQQDLTHTVGLLSATSLFLAAFYSLLDKPSPGAYALAGLAVGLGFLSKYNFVLLPIAALASALTVRELRARVFDPRILLAFAIALVIVLPHVGWLIQNLDMATARTLEKMNEDGDPWSWFSPIKGIASLAVAIIAFSALTVVIFLAAVRFRAGEIMRAKTPAIVVTERMIMILIAALAVVIVITGATHIRERWLDPFLLVLPLYLAMKVEAAGTGSLLTRKGLLAIPLLVMIAVPVSIYARVATAGLTGDYTKLNVPFDRLARDIAPLKPSLIVADDRHLAGNLLLHMPDVPVMTAQYPEFVTAAKGDGPKVYVWRGGKDWSIPERLQPFLPANDPDRVIRAPQFPYHFARGRDSYRFAYTAENP